MHGCIVNWGDRMKIIRLKTNPHIYSGNSYLLLGDWNKLDDVNTVVDASTDGYILNHIATINTGLGKDAVNRLVITHSHFDHIGGASFLREQYRCEVLGMNPSTPVTRVLRDGEELRLADCYFTVLHTPGHSSDSLCLYNKKDGVLFSGDTSIRVFSNDGTYTEEYIASIEKLAKLHVRIVYPGHGEPITENPDAIIKETLKILQKTK